MGEAAGPVVEVMLPPLAKPRCRQATFAKLTRAEVVAKLLHTVPHVPFHCTSAGVGKWRSSGSAQQVKDGECHGGWGFHAGAGL